MTATDETVTKQMLQGRPLILLNSESDKNTYRILVQTPKELPAHDMGLDSIKFNENAIKQGIQGLVGTFVYDETQSRHNQKINPELRGHKFAKVVNGGYCPGYGGYVDAEVFDEKYVSLMDQAMDSYRRGIPLKEGPSTEAFITEHKKYGANNMEATKLDYKGLVWIDNPRDKSLGVCDVVLNSIQNYKGGDNLTDKTISENEYNELLKAKQEKETKEQELTTLQAAYKKGEGLYKKGKAAYDKVTKELKEAKDQLQPFLDAQDREKEAIINSIIEADKSHDKNALEKKSFEDVKKIHVINGILAKQPKEKQTALKTKLEAMTLGEIEGGIEILNSIQPANQDGQSHGRGRPRGVVVKVKDEDGKDIDLNKVNKEMDELIGTGGDD